MASSSTTSSLTSQPCKYDVFLNFRGEDTRRNFTSHLYAALCQKDLHTFFDDDELKRGEEIAWSLPKAIQYSTIAVLIFSKNYASSAWCLDELVKIIECHESHGQIVIPIFYEVDPTHLRKQSHDVAATFVKHEQNPKKAHKTPSWRDALTTAANLRGFDSKDFRNDHMLINKILEDILEKLNQSMTSDDYDHLVGMNSHIEEIKKVFNIKISDIRILGIWGMGGIGKTTTAEVVYNMMSHQFQGCCFVHNVRQRVEAGGLMKLQEDLISKAFGEENAVKYMLSSGPRPFLKARLGRKNMLIVLDNVDDPVQLERLIGDPCWFGSGSMILITSRDKQIFRGITDFIYEVKPLNYEEALQLFMKSAFKLKYLRDEYLSLSNSMVKYAQGNPLALKVLGSSLVGKKEKEWESALNQLSKVPNKNIIDVLQISFNGLNRVEKDVFLDIACFFKCDRAHVVKGVLKDYGLDPDTVISTLVDKCLLTICGNVLIMHDLLQEMGKEIVRQEAKYPSQRSRLWDHEDIYEVFVENKEAEAVKSIILDVSKIREIDLNPRVFTKIPNLKFLKFYRRCNNNNLHLSQGLDFLPNKLRYFCWNEYPLESFPTNFQPENLVVLILPNSKIKQLRKGIKEDYVDSQSTYEMLSMLVNGFYSLVKVPSYIYGSQLGKLRLLSFVNNKSITHFPNSRSGFLEALEVLDLCACSNLNAFPEISSNIKELNLNWTAIKHVPSSSLEFLSKLKELQMMFCEELESFPRNFFNKLTSLEKLNLSGSSRFKELPGIVEPIEKLPSSIGNLKGLKYLTMDHCRKRVYLLGSFIDVRCLTLSFCKLRRLPKYLNILSSLETLDLSESTFEIIPVTIKQISRSEVLLISNSSRLQTFPEISHREVLVLENCLKLDEDKRQAITNALLKSYIIAFKRNQMQKPELYFQMGYPGSRMPEWVKHQTMGDSIQIPLPSHWFSHLSLGFAFYMCFDCVEYADEAVYDLRYDCYLGDNYHFSAADCGIFKGPGVDKEYMVVLINGTFCEWVCRHGNLAKDVAFFKFTSSVKSEIKKCGIIPLYAQKDEDGFCVTFDFPTFGVSKLKRSVTNTESFHHMPEKRLKMEEVERN